jgi:hypothetical protein
MNAFAPVTILLSLFAATASAQTVTIRDEKRQETIAPTEAASPDTATNASAGLQSDKPHTARSCLTLTGSRITASRNQRAVREGRPERECANVTGRAYDENDLGRTGRRDIADALRALDTAAR